MELTNQERTQLDLSPLTLDPLLTQAAQTHTENMAVQDFYEHIGLDGSLGGDRIEATGYDFLIWAENIAVEYQTPEAVVKAWMNSAGHRANILHPDFQEIGVGYYFLEEDTGSVNAYHYWTQVFSTPDNTLEMFNPTYNPAVTNDFPERVVEITNQERTQLNLSPLTLDPLLTQAAQTHTENMAVQDFADYIGLDGSSGGDRIEATGYDFSAWAENIAVGCQTPEVVAKTWMNSKEHRANILNPNLQEIGVGYYFLEEDTGSVNFNCYWTQVFGTPDM